MSIARTRPAPEDWFALDEVSELPAATTRFDPGELCEAEAALIDDEDAAAVGMRAALLDGMAERGAEAASEGSAAGPLSGVGMEVSAREAVSEGR